MRECEYCGAMLDPGERCDCKQAIIDTLNAGIRVTGLVDDMDYGIN